jgi:hypothetical protein
MDEIAARLSVSKSSVSLWTRDVPFQARLLPTKARRRGPNALQRRKQEEIDRLRAEGLERIASLSERDFLVAGAALYAGEGGKTQHQVTFSNSDPRLVAFFCVWLRRFFDVDESRLRVRLYLHQGLDLDAALIFWASVTAIPTSQFFVPYRAAPDPSIRRAKHPRGCATVVYCCSRTHRAVLGVVDALLASTPIPG